MDYIHGYSDIEQERLIQQAEYWREKLILKDLDYQAGEKLLEIGCGAGAVLGILGQTFTDFKLAGIDLENKQIDYAKNYLRNLGLSNVDLRVGDAAKLPWQDNYFDHLYAIWFLEHLPHPLQVLQEAKRVLKPGGTITVTETDYRTILVTPESADYRYLIDSLCELLLQARGNPYMGQSLGMLLTQAGFEEANNQPFPVHHAYSLDRQQLRDFVDYVDSWLAPTVEQAATKLGKNLPCLQAGLDWFRGIGDRHDGAISATIYRASAIC
ncbi:SAM-dependent methyltransferase [Pleurocapsa sp. CCALA 161]|uniref:class I SAM-dependent methyltransferase n=1 Tax=Pleurocapsa sp. CCALA 161 TaxID=2107688 RepID=UPI000D068B4A|nr:methyltransferase domain-containing protein [Pleurocapsa sp. CCALA 161]PSB07417.1 SAM-dependent methyltransferase [Pleurocapsa sp. CCALA 161]